MIELIFGLVVNAFLNLNFLDFLNWLLLYRYWCSLNFHLFLFSDNIFSASVAGSWRFFNFWILRLAFFSLLGLFLSIGFSFFLSLHFILNMSGIFYSPEYSGKGRFILDFVFFDDFPSVLVFKGNDFVFVDDCFRFVADKIDVVVVVDDLGDLGWPGKLIVADRENYIIFLENKVCLILHL